MDKELRKPYIYTMPQAFMDDQSVPARWRLLGIITGFQVAGLSFYATNEWIMNELNCSQQTVSAAIKELEELKEIKVKRDGMNRVINRILTHKGTNQLVGGYKLTSVKGTNQLVHNSDINSDNIIQKDLPDWLNKESWSEWEEHRKQKKQKLTPLAMKKQLKFLEANKKDHVKIIERSIQNGWTGLFELSGQKTNTPSNTQFSGDYSEWPGNEIYTA